MQTVVLRLYAVSREWVLVNSDSLIDHMFLTLNYPFLNSQLPRPQEAKKSRLDLKQWFFNLENKVA